MLRRGMVLTVGTGTRPETDMAEPLSKSVREANPDAVVFLTTQASAPVAQRIRERVPGVQHWQEIRLRSGDDIEEAFRCALEAFRALVRLGLSPQDLTADYTSGTKAMTAGLALAAVAFRCGSLRYITGHREGGTVVSGTERFEVTPPAAVLGLYDLTLAEALLRRLQFGAAASLCQGINPYLLTEEDRRRREALAQVAQAYEAWDRFRHHEAVDRLRGADPEALPEDLRVDPALLPRVHGLGNAVHQGRYTPDLLADLLANASRRLLEGRWDDAVARLYRVTEMLAQKVLKERHGVDTSRPDPARLPEPARPAAGDGSPLGLERAYRVLEALGEPIAQGFFRHLKGLLQERNESILAHGTRPVGEGAARRFFREVTRLLALEVADIEERARSLQFPWLRGEMDRLWRDEA